MTFARLQGGAYTRMGRNLRERVWGTESPCRFAAPPLTCGPALGLPPGYSGSSTPPHPSRLRRATFPPQGGRLAGGRPSVPPLRYSQPSPGGRVRAPAPTKYGELSGLSIGAGPQAAFGRAPHPPPSGAPSPKGEGFRAADSRPYSPPETVGAHSMRPPEFAPVPLVRKRQARERNRTSPNFPPTQAPSGAGRDRTQALLILRAGNFPPDPRGNPRKWGS